MIATTRTKRLEARVFEIRLRSSAPSKVRTHHLLLSFNANSSSDTIDLLDNTLTLLLKEEISTERSAMRVVDVLDSGRSRSGERHEIKLCSHVFTIPVAHKHPRVHIKLQGNGVLTISGALADCSQVFQQVLPLYGLEDASRRAYGSTEGLSWREQARREEKRSVGGGSSNGVVVGVGSELSVRMVVPNDVVGVLLGHRTSTLRSLEAITGCAIVVDSEINCIHDCWSGRGTLLFASASCFCMQHSHTCVYRWTSSVALRSRCSNRLRRVLCFSVIGDPRAPIACVDGFDERRVFLPERVPRHLQAPYARARDVSHRCTQTAENPERHRGSAMRNERCR